MAPLILKYARATSKLTHVRTPAALVPIADWSQQGREFVQALRKDLRRTQLEQQRLGRKLVGRAGGHHPNRLDPWRTSSSGSDSGKWRGTARQSQSQQSTRR